MKATHKRPTAGITPAVILRGAALYLQRYGWTQGAFYDITSPGLLPPACATGAIRMAALGDQTFTYRVPDDTPDTRIATTTQRIFAACLDADFDPGVTSAIDTIGDWNDDNRRTAAEVIHALTDAANDWDRLHNQGGDIA